MTPDRFWPTTAPPSNACSLPPNPTHAGRHGAQYSLSVALTVRILIASPFSHSHPNSGTRPTPSSNSVRPFSPAPRPVSERLLTLPT